MASAQVATSATTTEVEGARGPRESTLGSELALLAEARGLVANDPNGALVRVARHRETYPSGVLAAERELIALDALRHSGRYVEARAIGQAWLAREPEGMHAARVRAILESLP